MWEGAGRPNITEIFLTPKLWPSTLCLSRSPWLLNRSPGVCWVLAFLTTTLVSLPLQLYSPELARRTQLSSVKFVGLILPSMSHAVIWTRLNWLVELNCPQLNSSALYYLQCPTRWYGHASTPPQLLPISSDRDVSLPLPLEWPVWSSSSGNNCHAVQRVTLFRCVSLWEYNGIFFFYLVPFHQRIENFAVPPDHKVKLKKNVTR